MRHDVTLNVVGTGRNIPGLCIPTCPSNPYSIQIAMASAVVSAIVRVVAMEGAGWVAAVLGVATGVTGLVVVVKGAAKEAEMVAGKAKEMESAKLEKQRAEEARDADLAESGMGEAVVAGVEAAEGAEGVEGADSSGAVPRVPVEAESMMVAVDLTAADSEEAAAPRVAGGHV